MEDFKHRLLKMAKHIGKWARRQGITCYRIYDNDIPEYPFSVDRYEDALYICLYHRHHERSEESQAVWINECIQLIGDTLDIPEHKVFLKERQRQKGKSQYEKLDDQTHIFTVQENGLSFLVNLSDYLDTGLFLDHRNTREMVRKASAGRHVLNLFAYTGSFSVYAAAGHAASTCTVDLSNTYLQWAGKNMQINGFSVGDQHRMIQADVKQFLADHRSPDFDLIVIDPPTFSNSKRMQDVLDIQRDYAELLNHCIRISNPGGLIYFSTNYRGFQFDPSLLNAHKIQEITHLTIPNDFRNKKIHKCYLITVD